jgi:hypothetical protein
MVPLYIFALASTESITILRLLRRASRWDKYWAALALRSRAEGAQIHAGPFEAQWCLQWPTARALASPDLREQETERGIGPVGTLGGGRHGGGAWAEGVADVVGGHARLHAGGGKRTWLGGANADAIGAPIAEAGGTIGEEAWGERHALIPPGLAERLWIPVGGRQDTVRFLHRREGAQGLVRL